VSSAGKVHFSGLKPGNYSVVAACSGALPKHDIVEVSANHNPHRYWELDKGLSIKGTVVTASGSSAGRVRVQITTVRGGPGVTRPCITDERGRFECAGLRPGAYECVAAAEGERPLSDPVSLTLEQAPIDSVVLRLYPAGTLRALVRSAEGRPRGNTVVFAQPETGIVRELLRRGAGEYVLENVQLGAYLVFEGFPKRNPDGKSVRLSAPGQVVTVELPARRSAKISGRVVDDDGHPVLDAWVTAEGGVLTQAEVGPAPVLTDSDGGFELEGVLQGDTYCLKAEAASGEAVNDQVVAGAHVKLQLERYVSVSGHVGDASGKAVSDFTIHYDNGQQGSGRTFSDPSGAWRLASLLPGKWTLLARSTSGEATRVIDLGRGSEPHVAFTLDSPAVPTEAGPSHPLAMESPQGGDP
jgi:protocatechuate 3,4-dioxygenase beta subunit